MNDNLTADIYELQDRLKITLLFEIPFSDKIKMADEEQKTEHINLKVAGQDGSVVQFKIKKVKNIIDKSR